MKLIIAEKPSVAKSIASALGVRSGADGSFSGNGYIVSWCVGHLVSPMDAAGYKENFKKWRYDDLPILPEPFRYVIAPGKEAAFENLRTLINRPDVDTVVNACDAGREGELIFRLVYEMTGCKKPIETLGEKDIYHIFTPLMPNTSTRIILKKPKTESSIRKVWLPKTLAYILCEWKKAQDEIRSFLGDEYQDFNLVVALPNGRPCEDRIILKEFAKLREEAGLPRVVFHSLRHSSTTYKLKLNHGDLKATQGDTGHAEIDMITSVYAHILDEDRKVNAQKFETAFYSNPDLRDVRPPAEPKEPAPATLDLASLVEQLQKSPELASALAALIAAQAPASGR